MPDDLGPTLHRAGLLAQEGLFEAQGLTKPTCWLLDRKNLAAACHAAGYTLKPAKDQELVLQPTKSPRAAK